MRIGVDGRELCGRSTGVGRYLGGLLNEWSAAPGAHEFIVYAHQAPSLRARSEAFSTRVVPGTGGTAWEQFALPNAATRDRLDVFFAPAYTGPLRLPVPLVVAIHDVSFAAHPEWFSMREGLRRRALARWTAERARTVITISQFSKRELTEHLGVPASRILVIPPGITPPQTATHVSGDRPAVLFAGSIFNRRHVPELVRAFGLLGQRHRTATLDLVGDNRTHPRIDIGALIALERLPSIRWHRYVDDEELGALYARASAFVFLSEYEGLGLPPLEALSCGVPPLLLDTPVARESCGEAAVYVGSVDERAIANGLERILFDRPTRVAVLAAAPSVLARYDWATAARDTLEALTTHA